MGDGPEVQDWNTSEEDDARPDGRDHRASSRGRSQGSVRKGSNEAAPPKGKNKGKREKGSDSRKGTSHKGDSRKGKSKGRSASRKGEDRQQKGKKGKNTWPYEHEERYEKGKGKHKEPDMQDMINQAVQSALNAEVRVALHPPQLPRCSRRRSSV